MTSISNPHRLHPFPARMAPEIVMKAIRTVPKNSVILDSMCGSGTVLREAVRHGHRAIGFDVDPLSVLMAKVATRHLDLNLLMREADAIANRATSLDGDTQYLSWIDTDDETQKFIEFWFGSQQRKALRALSSQISQVHGPIGDALRLAISKTIITKEPCASLARDTSHSRPHKVINTNEYDVIQGFMKTVTDIINKLAEEDLTGMAEIRRADARRLPYWLTGQVHLVVTSPPYGNAIDYLRGHKLALVWIGYNIPRIRAIRAKNIGRQSGSINKRCPCTSELAQQLGRIGEFQPSTQSRLYLYIQDIYSVLQEIHRSLRPMGRAIVVVGNSLIGGQLINNSEMIAMASERIGLTEVARYTHKIPGNHRYLPPPRDGYDATLNKRMRKEIVLTFEKMQ